MLTRYWIRFREPIPIDALRLGCGVTARSADDAMSLLREKVFRGVAFTVADMEADIDVSRIEDLRIRPNMGVVVWRGIWFPLGYD
ncbi:hypothetical protein [Tahibacter soli]|uniref:Uncharacterized protein n=1 Tax=Tahibacter soli TaxID=2983605 RepID=A0A9X3YQF3_9GAMM|nr:hypothetical protein [Tahibacter soli]MDC8015560.1 hypothetical protein [Tahibacter soli]